MTNATDKLIHAAMHARATFGRLILGRRRQRKGRPIREGRPNLARSREMLASAKCAEKTASSKKMKRPAFRNMMECHQNH
ncbi:hypothetical protein [Ensifer canadensis]|uniref:hypothetical protein n=1 Tax=Ensifer canadensis TaxID=555315 RepID=UPI00148F9824|nr:hypothetical protein [Ensifer canadensis]UBI80190.1 hypothetical protein J3R84_30420 [Ensifer canadensis]